MTLTYSIPLQTVSLQWTPAEAAEITDQIRASIRKQFSEILDDIKAHSPLTALSAVAASAKADHHSPLTTP